MTTSTIATYLQYANLQIAAEAFLIDPDTKLLLTHEIKGAKLKGPRSK